jgi:DNA-binding CsgD family transcriptional regulator
MSGGELHIPAEGFRTFGERLAAVLGERDDDTPGRLCDALKSLVDIDYAGVFLFRKRSAPLTLHDEHEGGPVRYVDSPYLLDPVYDRFLRDAAPVCCRLQDIAPDGFEDSEYYLKYYKHIDVTDEYCFNVPVDAASMFHVTLLLTGRKHGYDKQTLCILESLSPVVGAVLSRYSVLRATDLAPTDAAADAFHARLGTVFETFGCRVLTAREKQIVDLTLKGYSDKLTARELGITPATVRNHKKNIFGKLEISSQGQLFALFLEVLQTPTFGDVTGDPLAAVITKRSGSQ